MTPLLGLQPWQTRLGFETSTPRVKDGGIDLIRRWIESVDSPRLVLVHTPAGPTDTLNYFNQRWLEYEFGEP